MSHTLPNFLRSLSLTAALVSGSLLAAIGAIPLPAAALDEESIVSKLEQVPVFIILNSDGQPLTAEAEVDNEAVKVPVVFLDGVAASEFLARAREEDPSADVALVDLGTLFEETVLSDEANVPLLYLPIGGELAAATQLEPDFQGVPLFIARQGADGPYLTINEDGEPSLPMFFSRDDLQTLLNRYEESNGSAGGDIVVQVLSLEWLLSMMVEGNDPALDAQLAQVRLFPSTEVLDYIRTQGANPASAPAAPTP
jgi:hypothetical protein